MPLIFLKLFLTVLNVMFFPVILLLLLSLFIYKQVILLVAKRYQNFAEPIRGLSCIYLPDNYNTSPFITISSTLKLDGIVSKNELEKSLQRLYDKRDEFGRRCYRELGYSPARYYGYGFWKEVPNFKISDRVHILSESTGKSEGEFFIEKNIEYLNRQPFKNGQPLWDFYLHHCKNEKKTLMFLRVHHMLADGMSLIKFLFASADRDNFPEFTPPNSEVSILKNIFGGVWTAIQLFIGSIEYSVEYLVKKDRHALHFNSNGDPKMTGIYRCTSGKRLELLEMKKASRKLGCSISHICLAGINIGLEKFFRKYYGIQESPSFRNVSILPFPNHPNRCFTNCWTGGKFCLPKSNVDIHKKLDCIKIESKGLYTSPMTMYTAFLSRNLGPILPWMVLGHAYKNAAHATILTSNMMVPQDEKMHVAGAKITDMWFWLPIPEKAMALSAGIISSYGGIRINLYADVGCIEKREELEDLADMVYAAIYDITTKEIH